MKIKCFLYNVAIVVALFSACTSKGEWAKVQYDPSFGDKSLNTQCTTEHQGGYIWEKCNVYFEEDTLIIFFPAQFPAYWGSVEIKAFNGKCKAQFNGIPFEPIDLSFETINQKLILNQQKYLLNEKLYGYCDFTFKEIDKTTGQTAIFHFKGNINEFVRDKEFDPFDLKNFMNFDLSVAIHELGEPIDRQELSLSCLGEFHVELLNYFEANENIKIECVTWDISSEADISDGGIERLTIWYAQEKDKSMARENPYCSLPTIWKTADKDNFRLLPILHKKWNTNMQF